VPVALKVNCVVADDAGTPSIQFEGTLQLPVFGVLHVKVWAAAGGAAPIQTNTRMEAIRREWAQRLSMGYPADVPIALWLDRLRESRWQQKYLS
jgi:hypothetical protein